MPKKIEASKYYHVQMKKAVQHGRSWLIPGRPAKVSGAVLESIKADVESYSEA